jgi:hypothetical protein
LLTISENWYSILKDLNENVELQLNEESLYIICDILISKNNIPLNVYYQFAMIYLHFFEHNKITYTQELDTVIEFVNKWMYVISRVSATQTISTRNSVPNKYLIDIMYTVTDWIDSYIYKTIHKHRRQLRRAVLYNYILPSEQDNNSFRQYITIVTSQIDRFYKWKPDCHKQSPSDSIDEILTTVIKLLRCKIAIISETKGHLALLDVEDVQLLFVHIVPNLTKNRLRSVIEYLLLINDSLLFYMFLNQRLASNTSSWSSYKSENYSKCLHPINRSLDLITSSTHYCEISNYAICDSVACFILFLRHLDSEHDKLYFNLVLSCLGLLIEGNNSISIGTLVEKCPLLINEIFRACENQTLDTNKISSYFKTDCLTLLHDISLATAPIQCNPEFIQASYSYRNILKTEIVTDSYYSRIVQTLSDIDVGQAIHLDIYASSNYYDTLYYNNSSCVCNDIFVNDSLTLLKAETRKLQSYIVNNTDSYVSHLSRLNDFDQYTMFRYTYNESYIVKLQWKLIEYIRVLMDEYSDNHFISCIRLIRNNLSELLNGCKVNDIDCIIIKCGNNGIYGYAIHSTDFSIMHFKIPIALTNLELISLIEACNENLKHNESGEFQFTLIPKEIVQLTTVVAKYLINHVAICNKLVILPLGIMDSLPLVPVIATLSCGFENEIIEIAQYNILNVIKKDRKKEHTGYISLISRDFICDGVRDECDWSSVYDSGITIDLDSNTLKEALVSNCQLLHIVTHGYWDEAAPLFSYIECNDQPIYMLELLNIECNCNIIILNICSSGASMLKFTGNGMSMADILLKLGAKAVIANKYDILSHSATRFIELLKKEMLASNCTLSIAFSRAISTAKNELFDWPSYNLICNDIESTFSIQ